MVAGQRIQVGIGHAGLTVTVTAVGDSFQVYDEDRLLTEVPQRTTKPVARFKARKPEPQRQGPIVNDPTRTVLESVAGQTGSGGGGV